MHAVFADGSKQYFVQEGDTLLVEYRPNQVGESLEFASVLMLRGDEAKVGAPIIDGAKVLVEVVDQVRGERLPIQDYKRRKNYRKYRSHRQPMTKIVVRQIIVP